MELVLRYQVFKWFSNQNPHMDEETLLFAFSMMSDKMLAATYGLTYLRPGYFY